MALIDKKAVENLIVLLAGVLLFNGMIRLPIVGQYFDKWPWLAIVIAVLLIMFREKIADKLGL